MISYTQYVERLFERSASVAMHQDLSHIQLLDKGFNHPSQSYPTIHVAGSNGKGSVSAKIAAALQQQGYNVGLYTSPHLFTFRERIAINGHCITEEAVIDGLQQIFQLEGTYGMRASFFELTTLLAFLYFRESAVDIAVIETGLGGRLDATNVIRPISTVITSISREHAHILGEDLEMIAAEKAGIIKENIPLVLGPKARYQSIYERAKTLHAPLYLSKKISQFFDEENSAVAELALQHLPLSLSPQAIAQGIAFRPSCRFEKRGDVIFDVAHNPDAIFHLLQALHTFFPKRHVRFLVGFSADKDYALCLKLISDVATHVHLVQASTPRAAALSDLAAAMEQIKERAYSLHDTVIEGVLHAQRSALENGELLVIAGSFYIMADAKAALGVYPPRDSLDLNEKNFSSSSFSSALT